MIIILKENPESGQLENLLAWLREKGAHVQTGIWHEHMILSLDGNTKDIDTVYIKGLDIVKDVKRIRGPYRKTDRKSHPEDTVIDLGSTVIGGGSLTVMAGPCSVESEDQIVEVARAVKASGATILRGGAFKPRTSPYSFQGKGKEGLRLLSVAKKVTGLPVITEIMDSSQLELFDDVDIIQVGARNMQNFNLLKELGKQEKPVMIKRGMSATFEELLMSAEYVMSQGNDKVILCERGIRTFETFTRNTLDISAVPSLKELSHLPVIVDPSHATGKAALVPPMSLAAVAAGTDGLIIEVHNDPEHALSDGRQSLKPEAFDDLMKEIIPLHKMLNRNTHA